jgi:hypothetical protein
MELEHDLGRTDLVVIDDVPHALTARTPIEPLVLPGNTVMLVVPCPD